MNLKIFKDIFIIFFITVILFSLGLEALSLIKVKGDKVKDLKKIINPLTWEDRYVYFYEQKKDLVEKHLHVSHPTRGWTLRRDMKISINGYFYTTNNVGARMLEDYKNDENKYKVLILGDSFTFG